MKQGQINRGSKLGEIIYNLTRQDDVTNIVEIGTWNGMGSTKCILDGVLHSKKIKNVYSLECNKIRHEEAKINLGFIPPTFKLIHGTIVKDEELEPIIKTLDNPTLKQWLTEDINWIKTTPYVLDELPEQIDFLIIDGGEFSGKIEWDKLWKKCKYIILDDTNAIKHTDTKKFINENQDKISIIEDNTVERNGYLVCQIL